MTRRVAMWVGFAVVVLHNVEESLTMGAFFDAQRTRLPAVLRTMNGERFAVSLVIVTLFALAVVWAGARGQAQGAWLTLAIAGQAVMGLNGVQHAAVAVWTRGYAPGVITGLALCLPYGAFLVRRALREEWVARTPLCATAAVIIVLAGPALIAVHALATAVL